MKIYILLPMCAFIMTALMFFRRKQYNVSVSKSFLITVFVSVLGFLSTYIMYYFENLEWGGQSFFGAVLFFPIALFPIALIFKMPIGRLLDYATPAGIAILVPFKLNCYIGGCCGGRALWFSEEGIPTHFPSQLVEMVVALLITIFLLYAEKMAKNEGKIYPLCLIVYGTTRFVLNYFRSDTSVFFLGLYPGNFWALFSVVIGVTWLVICRNRKNADERKQGE